MVSTDGLKENTEYIVEFDYWSDIDNVRFNVDFFPDDLPEVNPIANKNLQHYKWRINSSSESISGTFLRFFNGTVQTNPANIYITNIKLYEASKVPETGKEYYYIRNGQGDIIRLIDDTGAPVVSYSYDSWGRPMSLSGEMAESVGAVNPYRYRGYRFDAETNLYYLQSRYYSPEWGRFINADAIVGQVGELLGYNVFAYTKNNPINMSDPSGFRYSFDSEESQREYDDWLWEQRLTSTSTSYSKNNLSNIGQGFKKTLVEASPGLAVGTLYSIGETFGDYVTIGKNITKITGAVKISPITLGAFEQSFKKLGLIGLGASLYDNMNYGIGIGLTRGAIDVAGVIITSALIGAFAASGGLAAIGIGLGASIFIEGAKWAATEILKD